MRFRKEAIVGVAAVLALQIPLTMLAITLLIRMGPAIDRLLEDNVYSAEAVEEMEWWNKIWLILRHIPLPFKSGSP